MEAGRSC